MLHGIRAFFGQHASNTVHAQQDQRQALRVAACALLLELAHADDQFTEDERRHIEDALVRHFAIPAETARELMALAEQERSEATDLYQFTSLINANYDEGQKMVLVEVLWGVVHADGKLSKHEDYLMRKLAILLELRPGFLNEARKRAEGNTSE